MNQADPLLVLSASLTGPDLLLKNAFRLAQMPVDASHAQLKKRQQILELSVKMSMAVPDGPCPVFPLADEGADDLREALHRLADPVHRLLDELFWFWPRQFGQSAADEPLALLTRGDVGDAATLWTQGEMDTQNFVSTHNLALLHLFQAAESDLAVLREKRSKSDAKASNKLWRAAFQRWKLLVEQDAFWTYLKNRVRAINDPRLPVSTVDSLQERIPHVLFSINAGLMLEAAKAGDSAFLKHQQTVLHQSGFPAEIVDEVVRNLTKPHRDKLQHLCRNAEDQCKNDPRHGDRQARQLIGHAEPLLRTLRQIHATDDKAFILVSDLVAETILHCQVQYGDKTENWTISLELLEKALPFALGESAKSRVEDNIKTVRELEEQGPGWCRPGYFDLPEACQAALEAAREHMEGNRFDQALNCLRDLLSGVGDLPMAADLQAHVRHCLACCLKSKSISEYNRALEDFNTKVREALFNSFTPERAAIAVSGYLMNQSSGYGEVYCAGCGCTIYGQFVVRTIQDLKVPFCTSCSSGIDRKINAVQAALKFVTKSSLEALLLARHFSPNYKPIGPNLETIQKAAREEGVSARSVPDLIAAFDLLTLEDRVAAVMDGGDAGFQSLRKLISRQSPDWQAHTLGLLYDGLLLHPEKLQQILPVFAQDPFFIDRLLAQLSAGTTAFPPAERHRAHIYLLSLGDERLRARATELLGADLADALPHLLQACGSGQPAQQKALTSLLAQASDSGVFNGHVDRRLLLNALFAARSKRLADTLLTLNERHNPELDSLSRQKASIRALKFLERRGEPAQRRTAESILARERARGFTGRFNVWQWRPAKSFTLGADGKTPWWAGETLAGSN